MSKRLKDTNVYNSIYICVYIHIYVYIYPSLVYLFGNSSCYESLMFPARNMQTYLRKYIHGGMVEHTFNPNT